MYTQQYKREDSAINVPENYSGNALLEDKPKAPKTDNGEAFKQKVPWENEDKNDCSNEAMAKPKEHGAFSGLFKSLPLGNLFPSFNFFGKGDFKITSEEILIIGVALFLIFTSGADTELGLMLILLLFIK